MSSMAANSMPPVSSSAPKPTSWAAIARKPAKPQPKLKNKAQHGFRKRRTIPPPPIKHNMTLGPWEDKRLHHQTPSCAADAPASALGAAATLGPFSAMLQSPLPPQTPTPAAPATISQHPQQLHPGPPHSHPHHHHHSQPGPPQPLHPPQAQNLPPQNRWVAPRNRGTTFNQNSGMENFGLGTGVPMSSLPSSSEVHPVLEKLKALNNYNPKDFDWNLKNGRVFIIKSYSEDDIHRSIKYSIWCSTEHGNKRLDGAYRSLGAKGPLYLLFSVNGSGHFCGVAEMKSTVDYNAYAGVWSQDKWKGKFEVKWIFVKDVPNNQLRHIRLENNDNKPVTNSRTLRKCP